MLEAVAFALALALLGAVAWIVRLLGQGSRLSAERDLAQHRLADGERNESRQRDTFQTLANDALRVHSAQFLQLAEQKLAAREASAVGEIEKRKLALDQLIQPIGKALEKAQQELQSLEKARIESYAGLRTQIGTMTQQNDQLRAETSKLVQALSKPNVRGRYGEVQLQRVAELAGMSSYCDFAIQESVRDDDGKLLRPDMIVRMPSDRVVAVDAKTSITAYLEALEATTPEQADACLKRFADHVVAQTQALGKKGYWKQFDSPEFVVMFVPGDQFLDAAFKHRPDLVDLAASSNVIIASPSTMIGVLRAVHVGWREKKLAESAQELFLVGRELHERLGKALEHADRLGGSLKQSIERYNQFVGSVERMVMPSLRRFEEAGASRGEPIQELTPIEASPRKLASTSPDPVLPPSPSSASSTSSAS